MKAIIAALSAAGLLLSASQVMADEFTVNVVKVKLREGCEYKKVPGYKKLQVVCVEDTLDTNVGDDFTDAKPPEPPNPDPKNPTYSYSGKNTNGNPNNNSANGARHANNGWGNGADNNTASATYASTGPAGGSGKSGKNFQDAENNLR